MEITSDALHNFRNRECLTFLFKQIFEGIWENTVGINSRDLPNWQISVHAHLDASLRHPQRAYGKRARLWEPCVHLPGLETEDVSGWWCFSSLSSFCGDHSFYSHTMENVSCSSERGQVSSVPMPLKFWKGSHVLVQGLSVFAFLSPINYKHLFYGTWKD